MKLRNLGQRKLIGHMAILGANLIFGFNTPIAKIVLGSEGLPSQALSFYRFLGAMLVFWGTALLFKREKIAVKDHLPLMGAGLFGVFSNQFLFARGLAMASPFDVSLLATVGPIMTLVLASIFQKEPITRTKAGGVAIGAIGAVWLAILSSHSVGPIPADLRLKGFLICFLSSVCYAIYLTAFKGIISRYHPVTLMKWMFTYATCLSIPFCWNEVAAVDLSSKATSILAGTAYVVFMATYVSYLLIPIAQKRIRPTVVSMYSYIQPIITGFVSIALGLDRWGWGRLPAILLIFVGVFIVTQSKSREELDADRIKALTLKASKPKA